MGVSITEKKDIKARLEVCQLSDAFASQFSSCRVHCWLGYVSLEEHLASILVHVLHYWQK